MPESFLTLRSNGEHYALPSDEVSEVIRLPALARVPQAPRGLLGLANLRGNVLPVASLRGLLGVSEVAPDAMSDRRAVVLDHGAPVALVVDAVEGLMMVESGQIETGQAELGAKPGERLKGVFAARSRDGGSDAVKILDIRGLIDAAFVQQERAQRGRTVGQAETAAVEEETDERQRLVSFEVNGQEYAFPLDVVQEVLDAPDILAALPASEQLVLGVAPHRDSLLPLLSLRGLLGFANGERTGREKVVVARVSGALVGLLADRVLRIFPADADRIEKVPALLKARAGGEAKISAIYRGEQGRRLVSILSPDQLFREDVMQRLNASGPASETPDGREAPEDERQVVVFRLGDDEFGLPIEAVEEVALVPDQVTRLPRTPKFLEGVVNLRGDVLPVVDQRRRFDMPPPDRQAARRLMVVRTERHRAGLIVDAVSEVLRSSARAIAPAPNLTNEKTRLVHGVINLEKSGRIIMLLDPAELLTRAERGLLDAFQAKTQRPPQ